VAASAALFGALVGLLLGLLGGGGSVLAVPALVYGVGLPLSAAVPASLVVVGASAATGLLARLRSGLVRWRVAVVLGLAGLPAALGGGAVGRLLPDRWLALGFAALMVAVAVRMLRPAASEGGACRDGSGAADRRRCLARAVPVGALAGFLTGLFGVGGGFVVVPALSVGLGLAAAESVATSLAVVALNSASGLAAHSCSLAGPDLLAVAVFAGSAMAASPAAGVLAARAPAALLRRGFAVLVLAVAAGMAAVSLTAPELLP